MVRIPCVLLGSAIQPFLHHKNVFFGIFDHTHYFLTWKKKTQDQNEAIPLEDMLEDYRDLLSKNQSAEPPGLIENIL